MFKRNDGYALSYVLVVLMVLAIIATAVMAPPLRNLQMQQASIQRMQDKYIAQGMIEQVVAQLERGNTSPTSLAEYTVNLSGDTYTITAKSGNTIINAVIRLTENTTDPATPTYSASYESYDISYNTEVAS